MHTPYFFQVLEDAKTALARGTLYVVATPIGNLADITLRALATLSAADVVCAEDTRVTGQLLARYGFKARLVSLREHNERSMAEQVIAWLRAGQIVAQVSDAGTPAISDPGARLAHAVWQADLRVCPIPGASAVACALSACGLHTHDWLFVGFLPPKSTQRKLHLEQWQEAPYAVVLYEAPHRVADCLDDIVTVLRPERHVVLARELTKTFETIKRLPAAELRDWVHADSNQQRGECVLIIDAAPSKTTTETTLPASARHTLALLLAELPTKQAAKLAASLTGLSKNQLYEEALRLKEEGHIQ